MMVLSKQRLFVTICVFIVICVGLELTRHPGMSTLFHENVFDIPPLMIPVLNISEGMGRTLNCPDVTAGMMRGRWITRSLTSMEKTEIETFMAYVRTAQGMPKSMQRKDGRCGNLSYENLFWFRALCNPKGPTPCCYNDRCVNKSPNDCHCSKCYDLRTRIHAEYSTWKPKDPDCQVKNYTTGDACHLLQGKQLYVVGDSFMRHFYTALVLVLSNNGHDGALRPHISKKIHDQCTGMYIFTEKVCRKHIKRTSLFCNGHTRAGITEYYRMAYKRQFLTFMRRLLKRPNTFVLLSIGIHDRFNRSVYEDFLLPAIQMLKTKKTKWPRIIWATTHKFGILKTPLVPAQGVASVQAFNNFMKDKLRHHNIPVFDTFNLTSGVMSPDGSHFGFGINVMKVQMFLNFFHELKRKEHW